MTGPDDSHSSTRPISVAELLARNGTIGAPPVGGRRRRRRGNTDSVTVAELTGEIPIVAGPDVDEVRRDAGPPRNRATAVPDDEATTTSRRRSTSNGVVDHDRPRLTDGEADVDEAKPPRTEPEDVDDDYADAVADYAAYIEHRETDADPSTSSAPPRRSRYPPPRRFAPDGRAPSR